MADEMSREAKGSRNGYAWQRLLFMLGFWVVLYLAGMVLGVLTIAQGLFSVISGSDNRNLRLLGSCISQYVSQILNFVTYNSEVHPFPFTPFPEAVERTSTPDVSDSEPTVNSAAQSSTEVSSNAAEDASASDDKPADDTAPASTMNEAASVSKGKPRTKPAAKKAPSVKKSSAKNGSSSSS